MMDKQASWRSMSGKVEALVDSGVAVVRLIHPEKANALTMPMLQDLASAIRTFGSGGRMRGLILTGSGRAFCSGDDLTATEAFDRGEFNLLIERFHEVTRAILDSRVPVIAGLNGIAAGGGAELALACDARVGCALSDFLFPENGLGLTISNGASYLLPRLIGSRTLTVILDARRIASTEAMDLGLIDYLVEDVDQVLPKSMELIRRWSRPGSSTTQHLLLLRPSRAEVEHAMHHEADVANQAWERSTIRAAARRLNTS
jgi:enoyl-CoA hydratase/carnithine racemase